MRKKRARRFTARYGVSRIAIEEEAKELQREMEDYLIESQTELEKMLNERQALWTEADANVEYFVRRLPEREKLVVKAMLVRDLYHLLELYHEHLKSLDRSGQAVAPASVADIEKRGMPFNEWLFTS